MSLVSELEQALESPVKAIRPRKGTYKLISDPSIEVNGWKFQDYAYYRSDLPTYARGLFTYQDRIIIRGYNKFFNTNEVPTTKWHFLEENLVGPYECTVKENGCIIFVSGVNGKLVVTSKHTTGYRDDISKNHAVEGSKWVAKHLKAVNKTEEELATVLEENGWTAVGELCDDSFEEHVFAYDTKDSGIYLTGLNRNLAQFETLEFARVQEFAREWGFIETKCHKCNTFAELKEFINSAAKTGSWQGREIEGFVVRGKVSQSKLKDTEQSALKDSGDLVDYFFKYKFDEPYYMYRQWRQLVKAFLRHPKTIIESKRLHRSSSAKFFDFFLRYYKTYPEIKDQILVGGRGLNEIRKKFLDSTTLTENDLVNLGLSEMTTRYVLAPVATIGCGKTTVGAVISRLTGWAHVQNDGIPMGKNQKKMFTEKVLEALDSSEVVIYDRNNHQLREREQMFDDLESDALLQGIKLEFVCLDFWPNGAVKNQKAVEITKKRVMERGNNHQTINNMSTQEVTNIMKGFVGRFQPVDTTHPPDSKFKSVVQLKVVDNGSRANVVRVLEHMHREYGFKMYNDQEIDAAMEYALNYKVPVVVKPRVPVYFGIQVDPKQLEGLIPKLPQRHNVVTEFHVTIAYNGKRHKKLYSELTKKFSAQIAASDGGAKTQSLGVAEKVHLVEFCYNDRISAFRVETGTQKSANQNPHITVAHIEGVRPVESNVMLNSAEGVESIKVDKWVDGELVAYF